MSIIRTIVYKNIYEYNRQKTGDISHLKEPPPENTFSLSEIDIIGEAIIRQIEGLLADKFIGDPKWLEEMLPKKKDEKESLCLPNLLEAIEKDSFIEGYNQAIDDCLNSLKGKVVPIRPER